jgi:hypothetical protein
MVRRAGHEKRYMGGGKNLKKNDKNTKLQGHRDMTIERRKIQPVRKEDWSEEYD